jgi:undecaprenyl pyrophosphate phosphatase UppP
MKNWTRPILTIVATLSGLFVIRQVISILNQAPYSFVDAVKISVGLFISIGCLTILARIQSPQPAAKVTRQQATIGILGGGGFASLGLILVAKGVPTDSPYNVALGLAIILVFGYVAVKSFLRLLGKS